MQTMAQTPSAAFRTLSNPDARLPLPACLKTAVSYTEKDNLIAAVRVGLDHHGIDYKTLSRLTVAWPQKDPRTKHINDAASHADELCRALADAFPGKDILRADALYETRHLGRSERADMQYTLTARQSFAVDPDLQKTPLPFITDDGARGEAFVLTDWISMQGTTLAALSSYITHNGGHVVAVALPYGGKPLLQQNDRSGTYDRALPDRGQIQSLASTFRAAAAGNGNYTGAECVALFDRALRLHGLSLDTLTNGEALSLRSEMTSRYVSFSSFVEKLGISQMAQHDYIHALRRSGGPR